MAGSTVQTRVGNTIVDVWKVELGAPTIMVAILQHSTNLGLTDFTVGSSKARETVANIAAQHILAWTSIQTWLITSTNISWKNFQLYGKASIEQERITNKLTCEHNMLVVRIRCGVSGIIVTNSLLCAGSVVWHQELSSLFFIPLLTHWVILRYWKMHWIRWRWALPHRCRCNSQVSWDLHKQILPHLLVLWFSHPPVLQSEFPSRELWYLWREFLEWQMHGTCAPKSIHVCSTAELTKRHWASVAWIKDEVISIVVYDANGADVIAAGKGITGQLFVPHLVSCGVEITFSPVGSFSQGSWRSIWNKDDDLKTHWLSPSDDAVTIAWITLVDSLFIHTSGPGAVGGAVLYLLMHSDTE